MNQELEKAIDKAGRSTVFAKAKELGWGNETPPVWAWWGIVNEVNKDRVYGRSPTVPNGDRV